MDGSCSTYGGRGEVYRGFYWGNLRERTHGKHWHRWEDNIKIDFRKWDVGVWTGSICLKIWTDGVNL